MIQVEAMKEAVQLLQDAGFSRQDAIELAESPGDQQHLRGAGLDPA